ncbi:hemagglutinin repeat-containing protein [Rodentibacter haemolyticus]|uniref:Hemagglutinin repeat-containing protein n=1 Tax=Rodentibacter haemolyticus TaxID=2778911 RepID=A0ABX6V104_9PAST|nr:hemagglutinin repeat-containing protein [Rodentibacter haemolyticus]QPB43230.1 hemagglutinin repeat-containing protein [Rodentibacter haemolyticus]
MAAANAGWTAYRAGQTLGQVGKSLGELMQNGTVPTEAVSVSITYSEQKSEETRRTEGSTANNSQVNAGGKVMIQASGGGKQSNINIIGSDVGGKQGTALIADNDVNLTAQQQTHKERSRNKSSGFNAGVAIAVGNGVSFGITAGGNYGRGYGNGDDETYRNSHIGDSSSQTLIQAGNNATLKGAQVQGKGVVLNAENLHIESLQDKMKYQGKQMNVSGQVTVGYGFSASGSYSQSNIKSDYASVVEQSGIYAGDEGYQINVGNHTSLKGGLITSSQQAEDQGKNRFSTGTLTAQNVENHANYKGTSFGVSGSTSMGGGEAAKEVGGAKLMAFGSNTLETGKDENGNPTKILKGDFNGRLSAGMGYDKASQSSITHSGINTKNIEIRDKTAQLEKTGKTVDETLSEIKTAVTTETAQANSGKLDNQFDKDKVLKELNVQVKVTKDFRENAFSTINAYVEPKQAELRAKIKEAKTEEEKTALYDEIYKRQYQKRLLETVVGMASGTPEIAITQGTLQLAATKMREETLKNSRLFKGIKDAKTGQQVLRNDSYDSGYFDGVKLGGVRIDVKAICDSSVGRCVDNADGSKTFYGNKNYTLFDAIDPTINKNEGVNKLYGPTGGFQSIEGGWYLGDIVIPYKPGDLSDKVIESFAGNHDFKGGQIWGFYDKDGNTAEKDPITQVRADITTVVAIPVSAPFALSDLMSSDMVEVLMKIGGQ